MQQRQTDNFNFITNNDDYLGSMRSSRINPKTSFDYENMNTLTKNIPNDYCKFHSNKNKEFLETACTIKRIIYTPVKKEKNFENDSKLTLLNSNPFCQHRKFNHSYANNNSYKYEYDEKNKENSNIKSNFSSHSPLSDKEQSDSNTSSNFKLPIRKLEFPNNLKEGKFDSVRLNLQKTFNVENSIFFSSSNQDNNAFSHPLISSSESSSQDNTYISKNENNSSNEKEIFLENFKDSKMMLNSQQSNVTISESLLDELTKKTIFSIPKEKTNDEKYKILALKKFRKSTHKDNKSTSKLHAAKRDSYEGIETFPESIMECNLFNRKRKIVHSVKKIYASEIDLVDPLTFQTKKFRIFKDSDIGINEDWQKYLKESKADEDIPTDEELINNATKFVHNNLLESITYLYNNRDSNAVNNICFMQKP